LLIAEEERFTNVAEDAVRCLPRRLDENGIQRPKVVLKASKRRRAVKRDVYDENHEFDIEIVQTCCAL
jgi:hypothetical protein